MDPPPGGKALESNELIAPKPYPGRCQTRGRHRSAFSSVILATALRWTTEQTHRNPSRCRSRQSTDEYLRAFPERCGVLKVNLGACESGCLPKTGNARQLRPSSCGRAGGRRCDRSSGFRSVRIDAQSRGSVHLELRVRDHLFDVGAVCGIKRLEVLREDDENQLEQIIPNLAQQHDLTAAIVVR